jgi:hypothetical protein
MDICLLWVSCVVRERFVWGADHWSTVVRRCVWSRHLVNEEALAHCGQFRQKQTNYLTWDQVQKGADELKHPSPAEQSGTSWIGFQFCKNICRKDTVLKEIIFFFWKSCIKRKFRTDPSAPKNCTDSLIRINGEISNSCTCRIFVILWLAAKTGLIFWNPWKLI